MEKEFFTKEQRNEIYKYALKYFINNKFIIYDDLTTGMCFPMYLAIEHFFNIDFLYKDLKKNLPEFFAFKPKTTWKKNKAYWFSPNINYKGYDKRVSILTALAKGQSAEEWKKEWKAAGNR